jgi:hypothetical protein
MSWVQLVIQWVIFAVKPISQSPPPASSQIQSCHGSNLMSRLLNQSRQPPILPSSKYPGSQCYYKNEEFECHSTIMHRGKLHCLLGFLGFRREYFDKNADARFFGRQRSHKKEGDSAGQSASSVPSYNTIECKMSQQLQTSIGFSRRRAGVA